MGVERCPTGSIFNEFPSWFAEEETHGQRRERLGEHGETVSTLVPPGGSWSYYLEGRTSVFFLICCLNIFNYILKSPRIRGKTFVHSRCNKSQPNCTSEFPWLVMYVLFQNIVMCNCSFVKGKEQQK